MCETDLHSFFKIEWMGQNHTRRQIQINVSWENFVICIFWHGLQRELQKIIAVGTIFWWHHHFHHYLSSKNFSQKNSCPSDRAKCIVGSERLKKRERASLRLKSRKSACCSEFSRFRINDKEIRLVPAIQRVHLGLSSHFTPRATHSTYIYFFHFCILDEFLGDWNKIHSQKPK